MTQTAPLASPAHPSSDILHHPTEGKDEGSKTIPKGGGNPSDTPLPPGEMSNEGCRVPSSPPSDNPTPRGKADDVGCRIVPSRELLKRCQESLRDSGEAQLWGLHVRAGALTLFVGETSVGKTVFLHNLAYHLAAGQEFLGLAPPRPLRVLCLDFESYDEIHLEHLSAIGTAEGWDFFELVQLKTGPDLITGLKTVVQQKHYDVVIIDPLMEAYPVRDENDNALANNQMLAVRDLARSTGAAVIVVHNSGQRKSKKSNPKFLARGATSRVDRADVAINFTWKSDAERALRVVKARGSNLDERITLRFAEELGYELVESSAPNPGVIASFQAETLELIRKEAAEGHYEVERKIIMERLSVEKGSAREQALDRAFARNVEARALRKVKKGVYALPLAQDSTTNDAGNNAEGEHREAMCEPEAYGHQEPLYA